MIDYEEERRPIGNMYPHFECPHSGCIARIYEFNSIPGTCHQCRKVVECSVQPNCDPNVLSVDVLGLILKHGKGKLLTFQLPHEREYFLENLHLELNRLLINLPLNSKTIFVANRLVLDQVGLIINQGLAEFISQTVGT